MRDKTIEDILPRLKAYFDPFIRTRLSDWRHLASYLVLVQIKNKTIVKHPGKKEEFLRFILSGAAAMLVEQESGEICFDICFEDDFLSDFDSLNTNKPSNVYIRTFEPVFAAMIDRSRLFKMYDTSTLAARIGRIIAEQQHRRNLLKRIDSLVRTGEDRYLKLLHDRPKTLLRTPQQYIASYLGVSGQNLSRIRRKIAGKQP